MLHLVIFLLVNFFGWLVFLYIRLWQENPQLAPQRLLQVPCAQPQGAWVAPHAQQVCIDPWKCCCVCRKFWFEIVVLCGLICGSIWYCSENIALRSLTMSPPKLERLSYNVLLSSISRLPTPMPSWEPRKMLKYSRSIFVSIINFAVTPVRVDGGALLPNTCN